MRITAISVALLLTSSAALRSQQHPVLDLKLGVGAFTILSGDKYGNTAFAYDFHLPAVGYDVALRWHRGETGSLGIAVQWVRFGFEDVAPYVSRTDEELPGAQRYVTVGLDLRFGRPVAGSERVELFGNAGFGLALERLSTTSLCSNDLQTQVWPCSFEGSTDSGGWFKLAGGVAVPLSKRFTLESALTLNGVIMGSSDWGFSTDDESYWLSWNVALATAVL